MNSFGNQSRICSKQIFWWQKRIWNPSSSNLHPKISHPSPRYEKNTKILASQEHRVSRNETSIFELFSSYFSAILFHFYRCYDDIYGKKTWRRETSKEQQQQRTPQLRPPHQGERTHHHRPPGWQR